MKVSKLIEKLSTRSPDDLVWIECYDEDCVNRLKEIRNPQHVRMHEIQDIKNLRISFNQMIGEVHLNSVKTIKGIILS